MALEYQELAKRLRKEIRAGRYDGEGVKFPSASQVAKRFETSRATVARAFDGLATDGLLRLRPNAAPTVVPAAERVDETAWPMTGRYARARSALGLVFGSDVAGEVTKETIGRAWIKPPPEIAKLLGTGRAKVLRRESMTLLDDVPVESTAMHFPKAIVQAVPAFDEDGPILVVEMIEAAGWPIDRTDNQVRARLATAEEIDGLGLVAGAVVFEHIHGTYSADGTAVEAVINIKPAAGAVLTFQTFEGEDESTMEAKQ